MVLACVTARSQEHRFEARLGWIPIDALNIIYMTGEDTSGETSYGPMRTIGIFSADFDINMKKWLSVGAKVNYRNAWRDMTGINGSGKDRLETLSIMPAIKFTTGFASRFRYYATLGAGAGIDLSGDAGRCYAAFQFSPVGIAVGKKISWYLEMGVGHAYTGFITGLTWRF